MTQEYIFLVWLLTLLTIFLILRYNNATYGKSLAFSTFFSYILVVLLTYSSNKNDGNTIIIFITLVTLLLSVYNFIFL